MQKVKTEVAPRCLNSDANDVLRPMCGTAGACVVFQLCVDRR